MLEQSTERWIPELVCHSEDWREVRMNWRCNYILCCFCWSIRAAATFNLLTETLPNTTTTNSKHSSIISYQITSASRVSSASGTTIAWTPGVDSVSSELLRQYRGYRRFTVHIWPPACELPSVLQYTRSAALYIRIPQSLVIVGMSNVLYVSVRYVS